ncbi:MAG: hypothetical protein M1823_002964 [Watsoniomyces obsoletus]|nr:MAG: hypothetical protein M1823_002964 [Watsoniomyces obsoletus]
MAKSVSRHYMRILAQWPKDPLRPETSFREAMRRRMEKRKELIERNDPSELQQVNALYSLLEDRYRKKVGDNIPLSPILPSYEHACKNSIYAWKMG